MGRKARSDGVNAIAALIDGVFDESEAAEFANDEHIFDGGLVGRSESGETGANAGAGENHGDGADGAGFGTKTVANAFVTIEDRGFTANHAEDIAFGADGRAGGATDAGVIVDVRMLGLRPVGADFAFFGGGFGGSVFFLFGAEMEKEESGDDGGGNEKRDEIIHGDEFLEAIAHVKGQADVDEGENGEGIAEWTMDDVPHVKDLLGAGKK